MKQSKRDLITAAFHNQETGRTALGFWHHFLKDETGADAFLHPELTDEVIQGQEDFYQAFSPDMIKIMTDGFFSYPAEILQKPLTSRKALSEIKPLGKSSVWFESQIAYAKLLQRSTAVKFLSSTMCSPSQGRSNSCSRQPEARSTLAHG